MDMNKFIKFLIYSVVYLFATFLIILVVDNLFFRVKILAKHILIQFIYYLLSG